MPFSLPPLYPILDTVFFPPDPQARRLFLARTVCELDQAGVTLLQLRAKNTLPDQLLPDAEAIRSAAPPTMRLILNDHAQLLIQTGFHGVHLGQSDLPIAQARAQLGPEIRIGLSTHTPAQTALGSASVADYLAIGPIFPTTSKPDAEPVLGLAGLRAARANTAKPLVAIGGITLANAPSVWEAGADSVAILSALFQPGSTPGAIARDFLRLFR